jgi:hypothetical protein
LNACFSFVELGTAGKELEMGERLEVVGLVFDGDTAELTHYALDFVDVLDVGPFAWEFLVHEELVVGRGTVIAAEIPGPELEG